MKKYIFVLTAAAALFFTACKEDPYINSPGDNAYNRTLSETKYVPDTNCIEISVDSAIALCNALPNGGETSEMYKLTGMVVGNTTHPFTVPGQYSDITFNLSDNGAKTSISCYYTKNLNNANFRRSGDIPLCGSKLAVCGKLTKYVSNSGKVTPELKNGFIVRIDSLVSLEYKGCPDPDSTAGVMSVEQAIEYMNENVADNVTTSETFKIQGVVVTKDMPSAADLRNYGNFTFSISSNGKTYATCYRLLGKGNQKFTAYNQLEIGDTVLVNAKIQNYHGICEPTSGYVEKSSNPNF
jgi:hypothetical protein